MSHHLEHLRVQYGCGLCQPEAWLNFDSTPSLFVARLPLVRQAARAVWRAKYDGKYKGGATVPPGLQRLRNVAYTRALYGDITKRLPVPNRSCRQVYASHIIEHLPLQGARAALANTLHLLEPGGCFRLVVPDLRFFIDEYLSSSSDDAAVRLCLESGLGTFARASLLARIRGDRHHMMYDAKALGSMLASAGFSSVREASHGDSEYDFSAVEDPGRWQKPGTIGFECLV